MAKEIRSAFDIISASCDKTLGKPTLPEVRYCLPTPSTLLNCALGIGGLPGGCCTEIIGDPGKGKTSLALAICAMAQQAGGWCFWADAERRLDRKFAAMQGLDLTQRFLYHQPDYLEQELTLLETWIANALVEQRKNPVPVVGVVDSVAVLGVKAIMDGRFEKQKILPMTVPQQWTQFWQRVVSKSMAGSNIYLLLLNHQRVAVDFFGHGPPKKRSPGGSMLGYMDSVKIFVSGYQFPSGGSLSKHFHKDHDADIGAIQKFTIEKNSVGAPWREAEIPFFFHQGYRDDLGCLEYLRAQEQIVWDSKHQQYSIGGSLDYGVTSYEALVGLLDNPEWVKTFKQWAAQHYMSRNNFTT